MSQPTREASIAEAIEAWQEEMSILPLEERITLDEWLEENQEN